MPDTILIVAPAASALAVVDALRRELDAPVLVAPNRKAALIALRRGEFSLILLEDSIASLEPDGADLLYEHAGPASIVELNFAISSAPRVLRQVRAVFARRAHDHAAARAAATVLLQNELNASLTGLLLESQLALREATPALAPKLRNLVQLAGELRDRLRP